MYLGLNIRHLRRRRGLTQDQLAEMLGVAKSRISEYENGKATPSLENFIRLADFFSVSYDDLITLDLGKEGDDIKNDSDGDSSLFMDMLQRYERELQEKEAMIRQLEDQDEVVRQLITLKRKLINLDPETAKKLGIDEN